MANFRTHLIVAAAGGGAIAYGGLAYGLWEAREALTVVALVALGGILPDIDADRSRAIRLVFHLLAILAVILAALRLGERLELGSLLLACGALYLGVRYLGAKLFARFTVHRGLWHSLLAAAFCGLAATALSHQLFEQPDGLAWIHGLALTAGFVIHLALDELYSVDLTGMRLKRSFGTALKPFDWRSPGNSLVMLLAAVSLFPWLPPSEPLWALLAHGMALWR